MKRRRFLGLVPASFAALAAARCGGGRPAEIVIRPAPDLPGTPTPAVSPAPIPPPELILSSDTVYQGGTILASLVGDVVDGKVRLLGRELPLAQGSRSIYTFAGIDTEDPPGEHVMAVDFTLTNGTTGTMSQPVTVIETEWTVDEVTLPNDFLSRLLDPVAVNREVGHLRSVYSGFTPAKLWTSDSPWLLPVNGILTTRFGEARAYNGGEPSGHHLGTDLGGAEGTPVLATQSGRVVMAQQLELRGNMIVIDHGGGLFSGYAHLKTFAVGAGQEVQAGEVIGEVGSSGLSTGPHLHWEMYAGGAWVDALRFTDGTNGF